MNHRRASRLPQSLESSTSFRPRRQELAEPRTISTGVIDQTEPPSRSGLLRKKYYFCTVEPACMNHDQTYRPVRRVPAPRLRDADGSISKAPCRSAGYAATHPVQPLKGLPGTRATDVSYRALAPGGAGFCYRTCAGVPVVSTPCITHRSSAGIPPPRLRSLARRGFRHLLASAAE